MSEKTGKLIVPEGITRSGKSTQVKLVTAVLVDLGYRVVMDAEPTQGPFGRLIRAVIEKNPNPSCFEPIDAAGIIFANRADIREKIVSILKAIQRGERPSILDMQLIFMADRLWHCVNSLIPRLKSGENIICDRYVASTFAFGLAHGVELGDLAHWHYRILSNRYVRPALTIYVKIPPEVAVERMAKDGKLNDIFETEAGIRRTARAYEDVWEFGRKTKYFGRIVDVDGNQQIPKVTENIVSEVKKVLVA